MYFVKASCARAGDSHRFIKLVSTRFTSRKEYELKIHKIGEYEQEIHKIGTRRRCARAEDSHRCKSHAYEQKIHKSTSDSRNEPKDCNIRNRVIRPNVMTHPCNQVDADRVPVEAGAEPITIPCEPSSHLNTTNVSSAPSKTANFQLFSAITLFRKMLQPPTD